jgi:hypothetical protein
VWSDSWSFARFSRIEESEAVINKWIFLARFISVV